MGSTWVCVQDKIQHNQLRQVVPKLLHFTYLGGCPVERIEMKICSGVDLLDKIKFNFENFRNFGIMGSKFALSRWLPTWASQQCHATALPVIDPGQHTCRTGFICIRLTFNHAASQNTPNGPTSICVAAMLDQGSRSLPLIMPSCATHL